MKLGIKGRILMGMVLTSALCGVLTFVILSVGLKKNGSSGASASVGSDSELIVRGKAIARTFGAAVLPSLLEQNTVALSDLCSSIHVDGVAYTFVNDAADTVLASSLGKDFPKGLETMNTPKGDDPSVQPIKNVKGRNVYDIALPLEGGVGTVHVGMDAAGGDAEPTSTASSAQTATSATGIVLLAVLVSIALNAVFALVVSKFVSAPVESMAETLKNICEGKLSPQIKESSLPGAIGALGRALERLQAKLELKIEE